MEKKPFVTLAQAEEIAKTYPTPFYLYDEKGIRENVKRLKQAFAWNKGYKEYFAVKATPKSIYFKDPAGIWLRYRLLFLNRVNDVKGLRFFRF